MRKQAHVWLGLRELLQKFTGALLTMDHVKVACRFCQAELLRDCSIQRYSGTNENKKQANRTDVTCSRDAPDHQF